MSAAPETLSPPVADILDQLLTESVIPPASPPATRLWPSGAARGIAKVKYTHDAMIDLIIVDPAISQNALAAHFGYSASWISQIMSSDAFQARLAERKGEITDPILRASFEEQFKGIVFRSMEILREKLEGPASTIPDNLALRSLELGTRALGYGARDTNVKIAVNVEAHLEGLAGGLENLLRRKKADSLIIEGEVTENAPHLSAR